MKKPNKGQYIKDGYEIMYESFRQTQSPKVLSNSEATEHVARVVFVNINNDPNAIEQKRYYIIARREVRDSNTPEPRFYDDKNISSEHLVGLKKYFPASSNLEIPELGQYIRVSISEENSSTGVYLGPKKKFEMTDRMGEASEVSRERKVAESFGE